MLNHRRVSPLLLAALVCFAVTFGCAPPSSPDAKPESKPTAAAESTEAKLYEKTSSEAYAMGFAAWEKLVDGKGGAKETADYNNSLQFFLDGAIASNTKLLDAEPADHKAAIASSVEACEKASDLLKEADAKARGFADVPETDGLTRRIELQKTVEVILQKGKLTEMLVTGNQFREINDAYNETLKAEADKSKTDVSKECDAVVAAVDAAKEATSGLSEGESMMISQLLAHWLAPGSYDSPAPLEATK